MTLSSPTFTYNNVNQGNQTVTGSAAYSIASKTHTNFSNVFGLTTSSSAPTLTGRISRKSIQVRGEKYYDATANIVAAADSAGFGGLEVIGLVLLFFVVFIKSKFKSCFTRSTPKGGAKEFL